MASAALPDEVAVSWRDGDYTIRYSLSRGTPGGVLIQRCRTLVAVEAEPQMASQFVTRMTSQAEFQQWLAQEPISGSESACSELHAAFGRLLGKAAP